MSQEAPTLESYLEYARKLARQAKRGRNEKTHELANVIERLCVEVEKADALACELLRAEVLR